MPEQRDDEHQLCLRERLAEAGTLAGGEGQEAAWGGGELASGGEEAGGQEPGGVGPVGGVVVQGPRVDQHHRVLRDVVAGCKRQGFQRVIVV